VTEPVTSACPCCGHVEARRPYDIGSGPELGCTRCEWCWGVNGQELRPLELSEAMEGTDQRSEEEP